MITRNKQLGVRMPEEKWHLLKKAAELRGEDISDFVRRAVYADLARLSLLTPEEKKMLGVS